MPKRGFTSGSIAVTPAPDPNSQRVSPILPSQFKVPDARRAQAFEAPPPRLFPRATSRPQGTGLETRPTPLSVQPSSAKDDILWPAFVQLAAAPLRAVANTEAVSDGALRAQV